MAIGFDAAKDERDIATRRVPFERAAAFGWDGALIASFTAEYRSALEGDWARMADPMAEAIRKAIQL